MAVMFLKGLLIALVFGLPAGAIGVLCVQRTLTFGFSAGFATGLGSTAADVLYTIAGLFGISIVSSFIEKYGTIIRIAGSLIIFLFGVYTIINGQQKKSVDFTERDNQLENMSRKIIFCFISSFSVAILNPATFLSFLVVFSTWGIRTETSVQAVLFTLGIFVGTGLWWLAISSCACVFRKKISPSLFKLLNFILGIFMIAFAFVIALRKSN